jgi:cobalamin synthase
MRNFKKYKTVLIIAAVLLSSVASLAPVAAYAAPAISAPSSMAVTKADCKDVTPDNSTSQLDKAREKNTKENFGLACISIIYLQPAIAFLSAIAGVAVVISIVLGGIQYSSAGGDPGKVAAARQRISKAIIALLAFLFLYAFLNWLLPGGIGN